MISYKDQMLCHHGVKGQRWGVRRYQNKDGTLTAEGRKKYRIDPSLYNNGPNRRPHRKRVREAIDKTMRDDEKTEIAKLASASKRMDKAFDDTCNIINSNQKVKKAFDDAAFGRFEEVINYDDPEITIGNPWIENGKEVGYERALHNFVNGKDQLGELYSEYKNRTVRDMLDGNPYWSRSISYKTHNTLDEFANSSKMQALGEEYRKAKSDTQEHFIRSLRSKPIDWKKYKRKG